MTKFKRGAVCLMLLALMLPLISMYTAAAAVYTPTTIYRDDGSVYSSGKWVEGIAYVPLNSFISSSVKITAKYDSASSTMKVIANDLTVTATVGTWYIEANGRYFWCGAPVRLIDGRVYVPVRTAAKTVGLSVSYDARRGYILSGKYKAPVSGSLWYDADAVYWLSRIISAESRGESLLGQIAVGNVVLNRVRHPAYPNTIWGVIFDKNYGIQFQPVANGTIYQSPTSLSVIAAKICLEGYSLSTEMLYFMNPRIATSSWIEKNCTLVFVIGNHAFYK